MINDLFGIQVIVIVNVINHVILMNIWTIKTVSAEKKLVDKLVEECTDNIDQVKIAKMALFEHENECICS